ncbi:MAG: hypothetical protein BroJett030_25160 [Alphaproteobacteria bacterium]|nr:MAG: hypothetical protein BroJett030_25160 [Alphaproteobacteria bacterium]
MLGSKSSHDAVPRWRVRAGVLTALIGLLTLAGALLPQAAQAQTRTLKLHFIHTGEKAEIAYKKDGQYIPAGLARVNQFLRDWRRNEPTKIDPQLLDLVWEVYQRSGSRAHITVISAYRSPATNSMLRKRSRGVAKNSQHTLGRAMDFFLPDVPLSKLRSIGLQVGAGGVGYYPSSGSPFVHMDTGSVRHWPRMSRQELASLFPDGKTMHIPSDGKPLPGYDTAVAAYKSRKANGSVVVASAETVKKPGFWQRLMASTRQDQEDDEAANVTPAPRTVKAVTQPAGNPALDDGRVVVARVPVPKTAPASAETEAGEGVVMEVATSETTAEPLPAAAPAAEPVDPLLADGATEPVINLATIPVPTARPDYRSDTLIADLRERLRPDDGPGRSAAGLSAEEIEQLRRTAMPSEPEPAPDETTRLALVDEEPTPAAPASQPATATLAALSPDLPSVPRPQPRMSVADRPPVMTVASITPMPPPRPAPQAAPEPDQLQSVAAPQPALPQAAPRTLELALAATGEDGNSAREAIRAMIEANDRLRAARAEPRRQPAATLASVEPEVATRSLAGRPASRRGAPAPAAVPVVADDGGGWTIWEAIGARRIADTRPLHRIAEIRAPAYGMNALRRAPDSVPLAGFVQTATLHQTGTFSGSSFISAGFASFDTD